MQSGVTIVHDDVPVPCACTATTCPATSRGEHLSLVAKKKAEPGLRKPLREEPRIAFFNNCLEIDGNFFRRVEMLRLCRLECHISSIWSQLAYPMGYTKKVVKKLLPADRATRNYSTPIRVSSQAQRLEGRTMMPNKIRIAFAAAILALVASSAGSAD